MFLINTSKAKMKEKSCHKFCATVLVTLFLLCNVIVEQCVLAQTYCEDKPKILFYRRGQAALVGGAAGDANITEHVVLSNVNKEFLACVSSRNVEWDYIGEGEPSKFQESSTVDIQKYDDGSISYCLTSQITLYNKQSDTELSRHTGRYVCREIGNFSNAASVYVFVSKKNSPTFLQSRTTIRVPLSRENVTSVQMPSSELNQAGSASPGNGDAGSSSNLKSNSSIPTWAFTIPCVTTRPNVTVRLLKKGTHGKFITYTGAPHEFNPMFGFRVAVANPDGNMDTFYGDYKCVSKTSSGSRSSGEAAKSIEDFVLITLVKGKSFQVFPAISEVFTSGMLNLTCESEEPVIMKEVLPHGHQQDLYSYLDDDDYGRDRSEDIVETTEKTEQKMHVANYMEIAPAPGRTGDIQCLTEKGTVLHTWKYKIIRKRADKLSGIKFNKRESSYTCKSKLGSPGKLSFISCRTPSECRINAKCLQRSENCRGYSNSTRAFCERKTHFCGKIFYKGGSGLIRCIAEGVDEIRGFTDEALGDQAGVRMGFGKLKASETALLQMAGVDRTTNVANNNSTIINEGDKVNVTLMMGYYYFFYPVQWAIKFQNGSTAQIVADPQTLNVEKLTRTVQATLTLPFTSATSFRKWNNDTSQNETGTGKPSEIVAIHALIPLRSSVEPSWKTITLPVSVYGREGMEQLPSDDIDSDEVLVEHQISPGNNTTAADEATAGGDDEEEEDAEDETVQEEPENDTTSINSPTSSNQTTEEKVDNVPSDTKNVDEEAKVEASQDERFLIKSDSDEEAIISTTEMPPQNDGDNPADEVTQNSRFLTELETTTINGDTSFG